MTHRCIYCGQDHDLSESDIIPDTLTNARILNRNVYLIGISEEAEPNDTVLQKIIKEWVPSLINEDSSSPD